MSKMVKLLVLVLIIALPVMVMAQTAPATTPTGDKPYAKGDKVKSWTVSGTFTLGGNDVTIKGFTVDRAVTDDPVGQFYYKENNTFWTWPEGYVVTAPTAAKDLGFYTIRYGVAATPVNKIYKAISPVQAPVEQPKTGWKRGIESVRTK